MLVSIVTVCYNAEKDIQKTIQSVLSLNFNSYEYIIQDGMSIDHTLKIAKSYINKFTEKGILYRIISEKDNGVYDAMNKSMKNVSGEWCIFMNAGDIFFDKNVLQDFLYDFENNDCDILYGNNTLSYNGNLIPSRLTDIKELKYHMAFCHQASFTRTELILRSGGFDLNYKIAADYEFYLRCYLSKVKFKALERMVCIYDKSGISSVNRELSEHEYLLIHKKYHQGYPKWRVVLHKLKLCILKL